MSEQMVFFTIVVGTIGMVIMVIAVIGFVILYQRKIFQKHQEIAEMETESQKVLVDAVLTTKEDEQKRIAQELHDEIGSSINAVKMSLIPLEIDPEAKKRLSDELAEISRNVRRISNELMPSVLDELGFHQAISHLLRKFTESSTIRFDLETVIESPFELDKRTQLSLYRIVQELLNNLVKYSGAENAVLTIFHTSDFIDINLADDGNGFIPNKENLLKTDSLGLKNIISRLQQIHGTSQYLPNEPRGTKVSIHLKRPNS